MVQRNQICYSSTNATLIQTIILTLFQTITIGKTPQPYPLFLLLSNDLTELVKKASSSVESKYLQKYYLHMCIQSVTGLLEQVSVAPKTENTFTFALIRGHYYVVCLWLFSPRWSWQLLT